MTALNLLSDGTVFRYIEPPFNFNATSVATYPVEVTGWHLLQTIRKRFAWSCFENKRLLDFGCGVRFARTIINLDIPIGFHAGVDIHREAIDWLKENVRDPRLQFFHLNARNAFYNPSGVRLESSALTDLKLSEMDGACMMSVITHQNPDEARLSFAQVRGSMKSGGLLYFTCFLSEDGYQELDQKTPGHKSAYAPKTLLGLLGDTGWRLRAAYERTKLQQHAFVCEAV